MKKKLFVVLSTKCTSYIIGNQDSKLILHIFHVSPPLMPVYNYYFLFRLTHRLSVQSGLHDWAPPSTDHLPILNSYIDGLHAPRPIQIPIIGEIGNLLGKWMEKESGISCLRAKQKDPEVIMVTRTEHKRILSSGFPQIEAGLYTILLIKTYFDADFRMVLLVGT